jgi:hypothetical protein
MTFSAGLVGRCGRWSLVVPFAAAAVLSSSSAAAPLGDARAVVRANVLRAADVPPDYAQVGASFWTPAELATQGTWSLRQLQSWGYIVGYEVQFDRPPESGDPAQISSNAGLYRTVAGARASLRANGNACQVGGWHELRLRAHIGQAAHLCTVVTTLRGKQAQAFFVVWRVRRLKGSITVVALKGSAQASDAVALAKLVARRMVQRETKR